MQSYCQNCPWVGPDADLEPIYDIFERVAPGEPMPSGECPECGALCQPRQPTFLSIPETGLRADR